MKKWKQLFSQGKLFKLSYKTRLNKNFKTKIPISMTKTNAQFNVYIFSLIHPLTLHNSIFKNYLKT